MSKTVRKLRHWKQHFDENAEFIWRRSLFWKGCLVKPGSVIPPELANNKAKLKRFWSAGVIELAEFNEPTNILNGASSKPNVRRRKRANTHNNPRAG